MSLTAKERLFDARAVAMQLVTARQGAVPLAAFPGPVPPDLDAAYRCQDEAIALWPDRVAGWKVGRVPEPFASRYGQNRLVGPIFSRSVQHPIDGQDTTMPVFAGGFAAVEAEYVFRLALDAPAQQLEWSPDQAAALVASLHVGIEFAGSPLAIINELGAAVIVSDFGNNAGLLVGPAIGNWHQQEWSALRCECNIDGVPVGSGGAMTIAGGPLAGLCFALGCNASRKRPLRAGDWITTGAATGVHSIHCGQRAAIHFNNGGHVVSLAVVARAGAASHAGRPP